jgi:hypothetical protein
MTTKEIATILEGAMPKDQPFAHVARMAVLTPVRGIVQGITFEKTRDKDRMDILYFALPLCRPAVTWNFPYGAFLRQNGRQDWLLRGEGVPEALGERIRAEALPFLKFVDSFSALARFALSMPKAGFFPLGRSRNEELLGYLYARMGDDVQARMHLGRMHTLIDEDRVLADWVRDPRLAWVKEMKERALVLERLLVEDAGGAQKQLELWEEETSRNLGIALLRRDKRPDLPS